MTVISAIKYSENHLQILCCFHFQLINSGIQPMQNRSVVSYYSSDQSQIDKWNHFWNEKGLIAVENLLSKTSGSFSVGDSITMADCFLLPQIHKADHEFKVDMTKFPNINRVMSNLKKTPPFNKEPYQRE